MYSIAHRKLGNYTTIYPDMHVVVVESSYAEGTRPNSVAVGTAREALPFEVYSSVTKAQKTLTPAKGVLR